jgi:alternate signal-mediated exported protein
MKKSTKGALAASAAGVLLLGGAGSLAYWTADGVAEGGTITAGDLKLTDGDCDTDWVYADGADNAGATVVLFVPGDEITKQCTFELEATGDNLSATLDAPASVSYTSAPDTDALTLTADTSFTIATPPATPVAIADDGVVTSANDGDTITATFDVTIPFGTTTVNGNDTQDIVATLNTLTVTLTQVDPNP